MHTKHVNASKALRKPVMAANAPDSVLLTLVLHSVICLTELLECVRHSSWYREFSQESKRIFHSYEVYTLWES